MSEINKCIPSLMDFQVTIRSELLQRIDIKQPSLQKEIFSVYSYAMEYIVPSPIISTFIEMDDPAMLKERLEKIIELEEDRFIAGFQ